MSHELRRAPFLVSDDQSLLDFEVVHGFLSACYWSTGIPRAVVEKAARHSLTLGVYHERDGGAGEQVGYARVVTDRATYAYLCDVFIVEKARGQGLSKLLMQAILQHPDLQDLRRFGLFTRDAHGLYAQFGFAPSSLSGRYMERLDREVYVRPTRERSRAVN